MEKHQEELDELLGGREFDMQAPAGEVNKKRFEAFWAFKYKDPES